MKRQKTVVITGVSSGIGQSLAGKFAEEGYFVYGSVRKEADAKELQQRYPDHFKALVMDVTNMDAIRAAAQEVAAERPEGIDVLINNSGIAVGGPLLHLPIEQLSYQLDVNVVGVIRVCQQFAPLLKATNDKPAGRIIQISSVSGRIGFPFLGPYCASKFALEGVSDSLRRELKLYDIDVIVVQPGAIKTPIWNKSTEPIRENFIDTPYGEAMLTFQKVFIKPSIKTGLTTDYLSEKIWRIAEARSPRTRYTYLNRKFTNWVLPRILPPRWIDRALARQLFRKGPANL